MLLIATIRVHPRRVELEDGRCRLGSIRVPIGARLRYQVERFMAWVRPDGRMSGCWECASWGRLYHRPLFRARVPPTPPPRSFGASTPSRRQENPNEDVEWPSINQPPRSGIFLDRGKLDPHRHPLLLGSPSLILG